MTYVDDYLPDVGPDDADITSHDTYTAGVPHATFARLRRDDPVHWTEERALLSLLNEGAKRGWILAAHDAADGGLGVALAEMALASEKASGEVVGCTKELSRRAVRRRPIHVSRSRNRCDVSRPGRSTVGRIEG